jgi:hypothetical protein
MFKTKYHFIKEWDISRNYVSEQEVNRNVEVKLRDKQFYSKISRESNLIGHLDLWFLFHKIE